MFGLKYVVLSGEHEVHWHERGGCIKYFVVLGVKSGFKLLLELGLEFQLVWAQG